MTTESSAPAGAPEVSTRPNRLSRWARLSRWPVVTLFFSAASVVQTWPLAKHMSDHLSVWWFFPYDAWAFLWNLWWVKYSLIDLQTNPFQTDYIFYPQGSHLYLHPLTFVNGLMSLPLQLITGDILLTYNVLLLVFLALAGIGGYALGHHVTRNHLAGLLAGYIFAFTPFIFMRMGGHINVFATWPIPFFVLFLVRLQESSRIRDAVGAAIFWAILTYNWLEFATDAGLVFGIFFLYWVVVYLRRRDREGLKRFLSRTAVLVGVWLVISAPVLLFTLRDLRSGDYYQPGGDESFSADLLTYFTPSPLWGPGDSPVPAGHNPLHQAHVGSIEGTEYLGGLPLLLGTVALFGLRRRLHRVLPWLIIFFFFAVMALGPHLWINDSTDFTVLGVSFSVPLPYQIFDKMPVIGGRRVPARMIVFGVMALSVLAAVGLDQIMSWLKRRLSVAALAVGVLALALIGLEYWNPPVFLYEYTNSPGLEQIKNDSGDFTVLDAPLGRRTGWTFAGDATGAALVDYYQAFYQKPSFGGYLSRVKTEGFTWFQEQPGLHYLTCPSCPNPASPDDLDRTKVRDAFEKNRIKYVILHKLGPEKLGISYVGEREIQIMDQYLRNIVGFTPFYTDDNLTLYRQEAANAATTP